MGYDFRILNRNGKEVFRMFRLCSGNFRNVWNEYGFEPNFMQGKTSEQVVAYLTPIIERMTEAGVLSLTKDEYKKKCRENVDFAWGVDREAAPLPDEERSSAVLFQLKHYRQVAEELPGGLWEVS